MFWSTTLHVFPKFMFQHSELNHWPGLSPLHCHWSLALPGQHLPRLGRWPAWASSQPAEGTLPHHYCPVDTLNPQFLTEVTNHHHHHGELLPVLPSGVPPHLQAGAGDHHHLPETRHRGREQRKYFVLNQKMINQQSRNLNAKHDFPLWRSTSDG